MYNYQIPLSFNTNNTGDPAGLVNNVIRPFLIFLIIYLQKVSRFSVDKG